MKSYNYLLVVLGVVMGWAGTTQAYSHTVYNMTPEPIQVTLTWHDVGTIFCPQRGSLTIDPYGEGSYESKGCQLSAIFVRQPAGAIKDTVKVPSLTMAKVSNISTNLFGKVVRALGAAAASYTDEDAKKLLQQAFSDDEPSIVRYIIYNLPFLKDFAKKASTYHPNVTEYVAYGSTTWVYAGHDKLYPVYGVTLSRPQPEQASQKEISISEKQNIRHAFEERPGEKAPLLTAGPTEGRATKPLLLTAAPAEVSAEPSIAEERVAEVEEVD